MKFLKPKFWESRNNIIAILLRPISLLFYFLTVLKKSFISPKKFKIPIICVGNIYVGGTGKTPISIMISNILKTNNKNPAIIKKYYKDHEDEHKLINNITNSLILNKNRVAAIEKAERENFDIGILDDGFQDHTIKKTLNIINENNSSQEDNILIIKTFLFKLKRLKNLKVEIDNNKKIDAVIIAAAKVGGIFANNTFPADFIYENLMISANVIQGAHLANIQKLLFLGSGCIYPKRAPQPMREDALLTGPLEVTNEPYALAKIAGIKMCESYNRQYGRDYRSVMPTNLYGAYDNFHQKNSHVIPSLLRRFHEGVARNATEIRVWGTGTPRREFLHVDDMAAASVFVMNLSSDTYAAQVDPMLSHINVGTGVDCTIRDLAETIASVTGFTGKLVFDHTQPDGAPRRLMDISKLSAFGWSSKISLREGLQSSYDWFVENEDKFRG